MDPLLGMFNVRPGEAPQEQVEVLLKGVQNWNSWRKSNPEKEINLSWLDISGVFTNNRHDFNSIDLSGAVIYQSILSGIDLSKAKLNGARIENCLMIGVDLSEAQLVFTSITSSNLTHANFSNAILLGTKITESLSLKANFTNANIVNCSFYKADLTNASFNGVSIQDSKMERAVLLNSDWANSKITKTQYFMANLGGSYFCNSVITDADFNAADLNSTNFSNAEINDSDFSYARLVDSDVNKLRINNCRIYGLSNWGLKGIPTTQENLIITPVGDVAITVDDLELAQFLYLILENRKLRNVLDSLTSKVVLILGRFKLERKAILDKLRSELRNLNYLPILFDFEKPTNKDLTGTIELLARMSKFIIADITDPSCIPHELATIAPFLSYTPILPIRLKESGDSYCMINDLQKRYSGWVLKTYDYEGEIGLVQSLPEILDLIEKKIAQLKQ